jgi:hypothetical protein
MARKKHRTRLNYAAQNLTFETFKRRFSEFLAVHGLEAKVEKTQTEAFFEIVQEHLREKADLSAAKKEILLCDHRDCEKLIKGIRKRLKDLVSYLDKFGKAPGPLTASLALESIEKIASEPTWKDLLSGQEAIIRSQKALRSMIKDTVKNADRELTIDLLSFIVEEFAGCPQRERNVLIGATLAGAGLYDEKILADDAGPVERIPMKVSRAKKRNEAIYSVSGSERNNPAVIGRRKKERLLRQNEGNPTVVRPVKRKNKVRAGGGEDGKL